MSGILNQTGAVSGVIGTTSAPAVGTGTDGYVLTATGAGVDPAWEAAAAGGNTHASQWRLHTNFTGSATPITANLEEVDSPLGFGVIGASMTESSGVFTFPTAGYWYITFKVRTVGDHATASRMYSHIYSTVDNGTWLDCGVGENWVVNGSYQTCFNNYIFDVVNTTNYKVRFNCTNQNSSHQVHGAADSYSSTSMSFVRLGDT